jgi:hypothetical protein
LTHKTLSRNSPVLCTFINNSAGTCGRPNNATGFKRLRRSVVAL